MIETYLYVALIVGLPSALAVAITARGEHAPWWAFWLVALGIGAGLGLLWPLLGASLVYSTYERRNEPPIRRGDGETTKPFERSDDNAGPTTTSGTGPA